MGLRRITSWPRAMVRATGNSNSAPSPRHGPAVHTGETHARKLLWRRDSPHFGNGAGGHGIGARETPG